MKLVKDGNDNEIPVELQQMAKAYRLSYLAMVNEGFTEDQAIKAISFMMVAGGAVEDEKKQS